MRDRKCVNLDWRESGEKHGSRGQGNCNQDKCAVCIFRYMEVHGHVSIASYPAERCMGN